MYCKKCKKNYFFKKYCVDCGSKLEKKEINYRKYLTYFIRIVFIFLVFMIGYLVYDYFTSPGYVALKYFKSVTTNDIEKLYNYLDINEDDIHNKEILSNKIEVYDDIKKYEIANIKKLGNYIYVTINYTTKTQVKSSVIKLVETSNFINKYEVVSGQIVNSVIFKVPVNSKVTLDGIDISKYKIQSDKFDIYEIKNVIKGKYNIDITINDINISDEININNSSTYTVSNFKLEKNLEEELSKKAKENLEVIYKAIIDNKNYEEIGDNYKVNLKSSYNKLKRNFNSNITDITVSDIEYRNSTFSENGKLIISYIVDFNIKIGDNSYKKSNCFEVEYEYIDQNYEIYSIIK